MIYPWKLNFWQSGEWQVCNERIKDMEKNGIKFNPRREALFSALRAVPNGSVRVAIIGQDPYPQAQYATGRAFAIPSSFSPEQFPPTLRTIFKEYCSDLGYSFPRTGDLSRWEAQGILLWNAIPIVRSGQSLSCDWEEWSWLTREIIQRLSKRGIVFAFLGAVARRYVEYCERSNNKIIVTSHPSPRGIKFSKTPFEGSRIFSTINAHLNAQGLEPIDWKLDVPDQSDKGNPKILRKSNRVWDSNRTVSWTEGKNISGVYHPGGFQVHE